MGGERAVLGARTPRAEECTWNPGASRHPETPGGWAVGQKEQLETKGQVVKERQGAESRRTGNVHDDPSFQSQPPGPDAWRLRASLFPAPLHSSHQWSRRVCGDPAHWRQVLGPLSCLPAAWHFADLWFVRTFSDCGRREPTNRQFCCSLVSFVGERSRRARR